MALRDQNINLQQDNDQLKQLLTDTAAENKALAKVLQMKEQALSRAETVGGTAPLSVLCSYTLFSGSVY